MLLFSLFGFGAAQFRFRIIFLWFVCLADSTGTSDSFLAKICAVTLLRCVVDNAFVNSASRSASMKSKLQIRVRMTDFGPDFCPFQETSFLLAAGRLRCFVFFVIKVTPPFSAG